MQRFKNILLLMDNEAPTSHVFERAIALAWRNHARITVAGELDALPREMQRLVPAIGPEDLLELAAQERLAQLELLVEPERQEGFEIRTRVLCGRPFLEVIREVLREGHDLVMMMGRGGRCARGGAVWQHLHALDAEVPMPGVGDEPGATPQVRPRSGGCGSGHFG
ncbi:MAG: universal stress protein [Bacillota bacterium]|nr:universal stress protein [Bacillota bacterium]